MVRRISLWQRYQQLNVWNKVGFWGAIASVIGLMLYLVVGSSISQMVLMQNTPGSTIVQSGRDTIINQGLSHQSRIQSIVLEGRLTCSVYSGAQIPPPEVPFVMLSDGHAYLEGPPGRFRLEFSSPVRFHRQDDGQTVVINRFSLPASSDLNQRPITVLEQFEILKIPSVTIVYGDVLNEMKVFEVTMAVNGIDTWSYVYDLHSAPFKQGVVFTLPLDTLRRRVELLR